MGRPVIVWDNFPDNDLFPNELFLSAYTGRESGIESTLGGILLNPMLEPRSTRVALSTFADRLHLGSAYDPEAALARAMASVGRGAEGALATLAEHFASHPLIGDAPESKVLALAVTAYFDGPSAETLKALQDELAREVNALDALDAGLEDRILMEELREPAQKLRLLAEAGLLGLDALERRGSGDAGNGAAFEAKVAEASAVGWAVGKNSDVASALLGQLSERQTPTPADVFGDLFARIRRAR